MLRDVNDQFRSVAKRDTAGTYFASSGLTRGNSEHPCQRAVEKGDRLADRVIKEGDYWRGREEGVMAASGEAVG